MKSVIRSSVAALVLISSLSLANSASAASILVNSNTSFTVYWLATTSDPDVSANATFTITNWSATGFDLEVSDIKNTTPVSPLNARLVIFGFGLTPDGVLESSTDGIVFQWDEDNIPNFSSVEICAYAGPNCAGGGNGGLLAGETMAGSMTAHITGSFANGVTFAPIAAKIQSQIGSFEIDGCIGPCTTDREDPVPTPEPASLLLLGGGLTIIAMRLKKKKS